MVKKRNIGIVYNHSNNWIGGVYYIKGILKALTKHSETVAIFLITGSEITKQKLYSEFSFSGAIQYSNSFFHRIIFKLFSGQLKALRFLSNIFFYNQKKSSSHLDVVFPCESNLFFNIFDEWQKYYWIPDFQEHYYPEFFSNRELKFRYTKNNRIANSQSSVVFSSLAAKTDYEKIYPIKKTTDYVLNFVTNIQTDSFSDIGIVREKYGISKKFILCSNQFWIHKNHKIIINAIIKLKKEYCDPLDFQIVFTGKEHDYRFPKLIEELKFTVTESSLDKDILFLGFIPRLDQKALLLYSHALIQPSKFEGWNTSIEDAKVFSKVIIASDIPVHREQLGKNGLFFGVDDPDTLVTHLKNVTMNHVPLVIDYKYTESISRYEKGIAKIFYIVES